MKIFWHSVFHKEQVIWAIHISSSANLHHHRSLHQLLFHLRLFVEYYVVLSQLCSLMPYRILYFLYQTELPFPRYFENHIKNCICLKMSFLHFPSSEFCSFCLAVENIHQRLKFKLGNVMGLQIEKYK